MLRKSFHSSALSAWRTKLEPNLALLVGEFSFEYFLFSSAGYTKNLWVASYLGRNKKDSSRTPHVDEAPWQSLYTSGVFDLLPITWYPGHPTYSLKLGTQGTRSISQNLVLGVLCLPPITQYPGCSTYPPKLGTRGTQQNISEIIKEKYQKSWLRETSPLPKR